MLCYFLSEGESSLMGLLGEVGFLELGVLEAGLELRRSKAREGGSAL